MALACLPLFLSIFLNAITGLHSAGYVVSTPVQKWDYSYPYQSAKLGDTKSYYGSATFYDWFGNSGACGYPWSIVNKYDTVAVPEPRFSNLLTSGAGKVLGAACGQCFVLKCLEVPRYANKVFCNGNSVKVRVVDYDVPGTWNAGQWPNNHFDLQPKTFAKIADKVAGIINIKWRRVPCDWNTPKYAIGSASNPYWHDLIVYNTPLSGSIHRVFVKPVGGSKWFETKRLWGIHFSIFGKMTLTKGAKMYIYLAEGQRSMSAYYQQTS